MLTSKRIKGFYLTWVALLLLVVGYHIQAKAESVTLNKKDKAISECRKAGNVPALGFGYTVICIRKSSVVQETETEPSLDAH